MVTSFFLSFFLSFLFWLVCYKYTFHGMYEYRKCSGMGGVSVTGHVSAWYV